MIACGELVLLWPVPILQTLTFPSLFSLAASPASYTTACTGQIEFETDFCDTRTGGRNEDFYWSYPYTDSGVFRSYVLQREGRGKLVYHHSDDGDSTLEADHS